MSDGLGFRLALIAFLVSSISAPLILRALARWKSSQTISQYVPEHAGKQGTPTMGGLIVLTGLLVALALSGAPARWIWIGEILGFALIGFLDDFVMPRIRPGSRGLGWSPKLAMQLAVAIPYGVWTMRAHEGAGLGFAALAVFVVLFCANAYNFADGLDGMAGGLALILVLGLHQLANLTGQVSVEGLVAGAAVAGGLIPFLALNAPPARVFMGDVGALPIGAVLGMQFTELGGRGEGSGLRWLALGVLGLVLIAELVPVPLQILSVKLRKGKRLFPRTPIHHAFQQAGVPETRVVAWFLLAQLLCVLAAWSIGAGGRA